MKVHYLEVVTLDVAAVCKSYEAIHQVKFGEPDDSLGGARTLELADGSIVGVRSPLRDTETPIIRPYWLVDDIDAAVNGIKDIGGEIAMPPLAIPGKGKFALYILGSNEQGFWEL